MSWLSLYALSHTDSIKSRLTDSYSLHRLVYSLFPPEINRGERILYADKGVRRGYRQILVLSEHEPVLDGLGEISSKIVPESFLDYDTYLFEIIINPVRRENSSGRLVAVRGAENIREWFVARSEKWGFEPSQIQVVSETDDKFRKSPDSLVTLAKAKISGVLKTRERALFKKSFRDGLGRGKAFGCGLLQLSPVKNI